MAYNFYNSNQGMINQLLRQKDNIDSLIAQYQQMPSQPPIQNIINQGPNLEFEAKILKENEDPMNIAIIRRTLFVDESNKKIIVKEVDGTISKTYDIVVPLDEKDKKILALEAKLKEMEEKINVKYDKFIGSIDGEQQSDEYVDGAVEPTATTATKSTSRTTKRKTSGSDSENV